MMHSDQKRNGILSLAVALGTTLGATGALSEDFTGPGFIPEIGKPGLPTGSFVKVEALESALGKIRTNVNTATFDKIQTNFYKIIPTSGQVLTLDLD